MEKPDYYAALGLEPTATAADVEASYLAIVQFLDSKNVPAALRRWAAQQSALVDEAYAALTEADGEEPGVEAAGKARQGPTQPARDARHAASPAAATLRRPPVQEHEEDEDEFEDEYDEEYEDEELDEDYEVERRRQPAARQAPPRPQKEQQPAKAGRGGAAAGQPQWQERGRKQKYGRGSAVAAHGRGSRRPSRAWERQGDDRLKKMALGLGAGLAVVVLVFILVQAGVGPFARGGGQPAAGQPPAFDERRYQELRAVVEKNPQSYAVLFELGQMTFESDRFEESITWLERALEVKPDDVWSMLDIGTANFNLGDREKARDIWLKALEVEPTNPQTHWNLGFYYASKQPAEIETAMGHWQQVLQYAAPGDQLAQLAQTHIDRYKSRVSSTPTAVPQR